MNIHNFLCCMWIQLPEHDITYNMSSQCASKIVSCLLHRKYAIMVKEQLMEHICNCY